MVDWLVDKYDTDAVPWVFLGATIALMVAGIGGTVFFGVTGITAGLGVSIPAMIVGFVGVLITGMILDDKGYI